MKVICVDNFDRETISDRLIQEGLTQTEARTLADELNAKGGVNAPDFYRVVPDDHVLYVYDPNN